jgi:hypothetical protein
MGAVTSHTCTVSPARYARILHKLTFVLTCEVMFDKIRCPAGIREIHGFLCAQPVDAVVVAIGELLWLLEVTPGLSTIDFYLGAALSSTSSPPSSPSSTSSLEMDIARCI